MTAMARKLPYIHSWEEPSEVEQQLRRLPKELRRHSEGRGA